MRIAIDARLNAYRQGGIPQYTRQLLTALSNLGGEDRLISLQHPDLQRPLMVADNVARRTVFTPPHHRLERWTLPVEIALAGPDLIHFPDFIAPQYRSAPAVVTIHDLAFLRYPEILDEDARAYYEQVRQTVQHVQGIIAVSEATRQDIVQYLDVDPERIDVIYEAPAPIYGPIALRDGEARVVGTTPLTAGTFLLFVSTIEPRKNLPTLLRALRVCLDRRPDHGYRLVVAGARGWRDDEVFATVRDLKLEPHVIFSATAGQYDLRWLYNACRIYINPSLYEGFGLPLVEAMVCGAPCLAAATSSLPEVGGDAARYIAPLNVAAWADAIETLWDDDAARADLSRRGKIQAARFSWALAARETLAVYRRVVGGGEIGPRRSGSMIHPPAVVAAGPPRCEACGHELTHGTVEPQTAIALIAPERAAIAIDAQALVCPNCGRVALAGSRQAPVADDPLPTLPIEEVDVLLIEELEELAALPIEELEELAALPVAELDPLSVAELDPLPVAELEELVASPIEELDALPIDHADENGLSPTDVHEAQPDEILVQVESAPIAPAAPPAASSRKRGSSRSSRRR